MRNNFLERKKLKRLQQTTKEELRAKFKSDYEAYEKKLEDLQNQIKEAESVISHKRKVYAEELAQYEKQMEALQIKNGEKVVEHQEELKEIEKEKTIMLLALQEHYAFMEEQKSQVENSLKETASEKENASLEAHKYAEAQKELAAIRQTLDKKIEENKELEEKLNVQINQVHLKVNELEAAKQDWRLKLRELDNKQDEIDRQTAAYNETYADFILEKKSIEPRLKYLQSLEEEHRVYKIAKAAYDKSVKELEGIKIANENKTNELKTWERALEIKQAEINKRLKNLQTAEKGG